MSTKNEQFWAILDTLTGRLVEITSSVNRHEDGAGGEYVFELDIPYLNDDGEPEEVDALYQPRVYKSYSEADVDFTLAGGSSDLWNSTRSRPYNNINSNRRKNFVKIKVSQTTTYEVV